MADSLSIIVACIDSTRLCLVQEFLSSGSCGEMSMIVYIHLICIEGI